LVAQPPALEREAHPASEVDDVRAAAAGWGLGVGIALERWLPLAVDLHVELCTVGLLQVAMVAHARGGHAHRIEEHPLRDVLPVRPGHLGSHVTSERHAEVRVVVPVAESYDGYVAKPLQDRVAVVLDRLEIVAG
jgi:hypothetical protein